VRFVTAAFGRMAVESNVRTPATFSLFDATM